MSVFFSQSQFHGFECTDAQTCKMSTMLKRVTTVKALRPYNAWEACEPCAISGVRVPPVSVFLRRSRASWETSDPSNSEHQTPNTHRVKGPSARQFLDCFPEHAGLPIWGLVCNTTPVSVAEGLERKVNPQCGTQKCLQCECCFKHSPRQSQRTGMKNEHTHTHVGM